MLTTIAGIYRHDNLEPAEAVAGSRIVAFPPKRALRSAILILKLLLISSWLGFGVPAVGITQPAVPHTDRPGSSDSAHSRARQPRLAEVILANPDLALVLEQAKAILQTGLTAGSGYGEVWIRDLNTFIELALDVQSRQDIRQALVVFFHFQGENGEIIDGYIPTEAATGAYQYRQSATMPEFRGHKNTVETDQESSLIQAVYKYVKKTGDRSLLDEQIHGFTVRQRLSRALQYLLEQRYSPQYGLIWGATTVDWGDVQPEHPWGVELDEHSHRAIDVYDNAMFIIALDNYLEVAGLESGDAASWRSVAAEIKARIREHLWDAMLHKFRPHIYLDSSPFPQDFDEHRIYYHGGTAVAIEAGVLNREEVFLVFNDMRNNKQFAGAASIGLTVYPPYPEGLFKNALMRPFSYQNGGDWAWFGGRMIQQLVAHGYVEQAYQEILPMVAQVQHNQGFFEWYTVDNQPRGSSTYRGAAGVLGRAIQMLVVWAESQPK
jgi:hypothetical protein